MSPSKALANLLLANDSTGVTHVPGQMCYLCTRFVPGWSEPGDSSSAEAERILYYTLMSASDAGPSRRWRMHSRSCVTRASRWGRMGAEWLERQAERCEWGMNSSLDRPLTRR